MAKESAKKNEAIRLMTETNMSIAVIAKRLSLSYGTVYYWARKMKRHVENQKAKSSYAESDILIRQMTPEEWDRYGPFVATAKKNSVKKEVSNQQELTHAPSIEWFRIETNHTPQFYIKINNRGIFFTIEEKYQLAFFQIGFDINEKKLYLQFSNVTGLKLHKALFHASSKEGYFVYKKEIKQWLDRNKIKNGLYELFPSEISGQVYAIVQTL